MTPFQARKFLPSFRDYLMILVNDATKETYKCILNVEVDNERYTKAIIRTDVNDPTAGNMLIEESGLYTYEIYGQNSTSNLDKSNAGVVGLCETGMLRITAEDAWNVPDISIPDNVIYYE